MTVSRIEVSGIPSQVNPLTVRNSLEYFLARNGITDTITNIHYIGGCSNHALKVVTLTKDGTLRNWLVRLPGSYSEILINRQAEKFNTAIVAKLEVCPSFESRFLNEGNVLQEKGYKVEEYLDNAQSLTHENFREYWMPALAKLKLVHECGEIFQTHYNIIERIKLMCYTLQSIEDKEITHLIYDKGRQKIKITKILADLEKMEKLIKGFGKLPSVPCHNDIPPFNFMKIEHDSTLDIKIIDWEYSGMNDPMCDLAYIANENKLHNREELTEFLICYYAGADIIDESIIAEHVLDESIDRIIFYNPLIDLKVAIWSLIQVNMCNQSQYIEELRSGWGPDRYINYLEKISSQSYKNVIFKLEDALTNKISSHSIFLHSI